MHLRAQALVRSIALYRPLAFLRRLPIASQPREKKAPADTCSSEREGMCHLRGGCRGECTEIAACYCLTGTASVPSMVSHAAVHKRRGAGNFPQSHRIYLAFLCVSLFPLVTAAVVLMGRKCRKRWWQ